MAAHSLVTMPVVSHSQKRKKWETSGCNSRARCAWQRCRKIVTAAMVTCVRASAVRIRPHQGRSNQPENIMKWTAFGRIYKWRTALYVNPGHAGKNRSGKVFFCKKYTSADVPVGGSRRAFEGGRKEPVSALHMRPQPKPLSRIERDFLSCEQGRAGKRFEVLLGCLKL